MINDVYTEHLVFVSCLFGQFPLPISCKYLKKKKKTSLIVSYERSNSVVLASFPFCTSVCQWPCRWQWKTRLVPGHLEVVQSAEKPSQVLLISLKQINAQIICSSEKVSMHAAFFC